MRTSTTRSKNKVCGGGEVPIYPRDTCPTQTVTCLQVVAHIEPLGLVHGPPHLFFLFNPQTQWTPTISLLHFPKTRTHRTRVSPYSRDFLVPCWTPPPPFSGATFSCWGDPPSMHTGYPHYYYFTLTYEYEYDTIYKISLSNYQRPFSKRKVYQRPTLHVQVLNSRDHILTH